MKKIFMQIDGEELPKESGEYITNHGLLPFDKKEGTFRTKTDHFKITIEWWMKETTVEDLLKGKS